MVTDTLTGKMGYRLHTHSVHQSIRQKKITGVAHKNGDVVGTCKQSVNDTHSRIVTTLARLTVTQQYQRQTPPPPVSPAI